VTVAEAAGAPHGLDLLERELAGLIGTRGPEVRASVRARDFQRFAIAAGDLNPIYFEDVAAKAAGYPSAVGPPVFVSGTMDWGHGPSLGELRSDGTGADRSSFLPLEGFRLMGGGQDLELRAPVVDGAELTVFSVLESVERKEGRSGAFLLLGLATTYADASGELLVLCRDTLIVREPEP
jgi:acyl dehydratase